MNVHLDVQMTMGELAPGWSDHLSDDEAGAVVDTGLRFFFRVERYRLASVPVQPADRA